jgi:hypothetical protein
VTCLNGGREVCLRQGERTDEGVSAFGWWTNLRQESEQTGNSRHDYRLQLGNGTDRHLQPDGLALPGATFSTLTELTYQPLPA